MNRSDCASMNSLFPMVVEAADLPGIPGLSYLRDYLSEKQETELAAAIDLEPWDTTWKRRRQLYGWSYGHAEQPVRPILACGLRLAERMHHDGISDRPFNQMLINEYLPGQGISLHRDYEPFDRTVVSLSLLSPCVMDFRDSKNERRESLLLEPRSLLVLSDEARYEWQHGIAPRKKDRWHGGVVERDRRLSVTFRLAKEQAAN
jgi:alkylated DNA repair dioxygenase AlkB